MANSGSGYVRSSFHADFGLYFEWTSVPNVERNNSDITFTVYGEIRGASTLQIGSRIDGLMSIAGQTQYNVSMPAVSKLTSGTQRFRLGTIKRTVAHASDGTLNSVVLRAIWPIRATISGTYRSSIDLSFDTGPITRIPRASSIKSSVDFTLGNTIPVTLEPYSDDFTHDVYLCASGDLGLAEAINVGKTTTLVMTQGDIEGQYNTLKYSSSVAVWLEVITKHNGIIIGTTRKDGLMYIDAIKNAPTFEGFEFKPDIDTTQATGWSDYISEDNGLSIRGQTIYTVLLGNRAPKNGAEIVRFEFSINNKTYTSTSVSEDTFEMPIAINYSDKLTVTVVDSRGFKTSISKNIVCIDYTDVVVSKLDIKRKLYPEQSKINFDISGQIYKTAEVINSLRVNYRVREVGQEYSDWENITNNFTLTNAGAFTGNFDKTPFDTKKAFEIELEIGDIFTTQLFKTIVNKEYAVIELAEDGIAIGRPYDEALGGALQVNGTAYIDGSQILTKNDIVLIVANSASNVSNSSTGAGGADLTTIPLAQKIKVGDKLSVVDGKILVGSGVKKVKISGQIYCTTNITNGDLLRLYIIKNSTSTIYRSMLRFLGMYQMVTSSTIIEEVAEGDVLELKFNNGDRVGTICAGGNDTFLTVEVVE